MKSETNLFWSTYDASVDKSFSSWRWKEIQLSQLHRLSLLSHHKFNSNVVLYTYQTIDESKVPKNIAIRDASNIFSPEKVYRALCLGHSIAHISDIVRLFASASSNGIVMDMDAVLLRKLPECSGFFSSMPAKLTGGFAPKWGESHPPLHIEDASWDGKALASFPVKINSDICKHYITELCFKIIDTLAEKPKKDSKSWNYVLWTIKKLMKIDTTSKVYPPIAFCPVPSWLRGGKCYSLEQPSRLDGNTKLFGHSMPSVEKIIDESYVIQHFFESAFQKSSLVDYDLWKSVDENSLLGQEAKHILGRDWKQLL